MARLACLILAAVAAFPTFASAKVNISDVEDEVMCPICGTLLELSDSPQARREKAFVAGMIAAGKSKAQIEDALVAEYGPEVLAQPEGSGFQLSAYLVPAIALLIAVVALAVGVARWRRHGDDGEDGAPVAGGGPGDEDSARLDADIARYDL
jgi:cytochrome c-type biogenesis protein CcmH